MNAYIDPPRKLLYHIDRIAAIQVGQHPAPVNVEIDLSNRCNLGCRDCHFAHTHTRGPLAGSPRPGYMGDVGDRMDTELAIRIIDQLKTAGVRSITWTGGGEPTTHPDFDRILLYAHDLGMDQGLYTNGTMILPERALHLKQACRWVYVSLDACDRDSYEAYKGSYAYDRAISGIRNLVAAPGGATIGLGFLLHEKNWFNGRDMITLGDELGVDYVQFRPAIQFEMAHPSRGPMDRTWLKACIQWLESVKGERGVEVDRERFELYRKWSGHGYPTCYWTQLQTVITPNGKVWTCVNRRGFEGDEIGDLTQEPFETIWERSASHPVDERCRVMCRGHIANRALREILEGNDSHWRFV
jgi:MoaA/NifB/PqqE/SkfB family radical SAM enzyme